MITKSELLKELEEVKSLNKVLTEEITSLKKELLKSDTELTQLKAVLRAQPKVQLPQPTVSSVQKKELNSLRDFLHKLYRESQHPPVRTDIQKWRKLLAQVAEQ